MKIVKFEFLKIITNKLFIITFLFLWIFNFAFLTYQNYTESKNNIPYNAYKILNNDLKNKTNKEKGKFINEIYQKTNSINIIYTIQNKSKSENPSEREYANYLREKNKKNFNKYYEESKNPTWKYTGNSNTELHFLENIKNDYDKVNNYKNYINDILEETEKIQDISIFKSRDEILLKSTNKINDSYKKITDTKVNYENGKFLEKMSSTLITDFLVLILIFVISEILILEEKEKNLFTVIKSTKNGLNKTIISKIFSLFLSVLFICLLFYGSNFVYYFFTIGIGNVLENIQSIPILLLCTLKVNILSYLLILFSTKIITIFLFGILIFYLAIKSNNTIESLIILIALIFVSTLFDNIDSTSNINLLKSFNLVKLLNTNAIFSKYDVLRFNNIIISKTSALLLLQIITIILFITLSIIKYLKNMNFTLKENILLLKIRSLKIFKNIRFNNIFTFECYKLFFINKCIVIIFLFIVFISYNYNHQNFKLSYNEMFYKNYMDILSGSLTQDKISLIENTIEEYDNANIQLAKIRESQKKGELTNMEAMVASQPYEDILATEEVFSKVENKYEYIKKNPRASFVYDTGYNKLLRLNKNMKENDLYLIIITIIIVIELFIMEYRTGFIHILNTTKNGRKITASRKILVTLLTCTIIYIISIIPEICGIYKIYGLNNLNMSITSLEALSCLPPYITIFEYLIMFYLVRYISYIFIILIIEYICVKLKNTIFSIMISFCILIVPFVLNALSLLQIDLFPFFNISIINKNIFYIILPLFIVITNIFLYNNVVKGLE